MGSELARTYETARGTFAEANETLGMDLQRLCFEGPEDALQRTANAQPALVATSIATLRAARDELGLSAPAFVAGHSLGEFSALVAAEILSLAEALRLVRRRGELMQTADAAGGMAAVIGMEPDALHEALRDTGCVVANENAPGQIVIAGPNDGLARAVRELHSRGARRVIPLKVSAAFHSPAMRPVADELAKEMSRLRFADAKVPVVCNVDGEPHTRGADFPDLLARQVYSPVRWTTVVQRIASHDVKTFIEFGAGSVLTGLTKRIVPEALALSVQDPASMQEARAALR